jgi:hypothetical protein
MKINTANLNDFVAAFNTIMLREMDTVPRDALASGAFQRHTKALHTGEDEYFTEIDREMFLSQVDEGDKTPAVLAQQGFSKRLTYDTRRGKINITKEMQDQNKYPEIMSQIMSLGSMLGNTQERDLAHRYTFANATSYTSSEGKTIDVTAPDGKAMCATDHLLKATSSTYKNILPGSPQFSITALELAERYFKEEFTNQFGEKVVRYPDVIVSTGDPNTSNTINQYLQSIGDPDKTNANAKGQYYRKYRHKEVPYIATTATGAPDATKRAYWYLVNTKRENQPFIFSEMNKLQTNMWVDDDTDCSYYKVRGRYGIVGLRPRSIVGSFPVL